MYNRSFFRSQLGQAAIATTRYTRRWYGVAAGVRGQMHVLQDLPVQPDAHAAAELSRAF